MAKNIKVTPNITGTDNPNIVITNGTEEITIEINSSGSLLFKTSGGTELIEFDSTGAAIIKNQNLKTPP